MKNRYLLSLIPFIAFFTSTANAKQISFVSSANKSQLIELYTSQGCSSCPPAEHKISQLLSSADLWKKFVPIAFHVNYWNYLGWKDIYSSHEATLKQQKHHKLGNINSIYTPSFVIDGKEWRGFFSGYPIPTTPQIKSGKLNLIWNQDNQALSMTFNNKTKMKPNFCHFALLAFDTNVIISAGENSGLKLQQDFVALSFDTSNIEIKNHNYHCKTNLDNISSIIEHKDETRKLALVGWVSTYNEKPIQATGGWID